MLKAAEASLKALRKKDIMRVKAIKRPPMGVLLVIEAMCIINNVAPNKVLLRDIHNFANILCNNYYNY